MKLLGSGPDMATELKGRAEREGLREAFLREALVARLQGFWELLCLVAGAWGDGFRSFATLVEFPPLLALPQVISDPSDFRAAKADPVENIFVTSTCPFKLEETDELDPPLFTSPQVITAPFF